VVKGPRRMDKTSLLLTVLSEEGVPYVLVDGRVFAAAPRSAGILIFHRLRLSR
jgi:hypothetical protein